jgi:hypothetical protein
MQVAAFISVAISVVVAVVAFLGLRHVPPTSTEPLGAAQADERPAQPRSAPTAPAPESGA